MLFSFFAQGAHAYFQSQRGDAVGGVVLQTNNGTPWGRWGEPRFCPENTYVNGFSLKVERHQGSDDDTALNNIKLNCSSSYSEMIEFEGDSKSNWGEYGGMSYCPNGTFVKGFSLKVEPKTTLGIDETAVNDFRAVCGDYYTPLVSTNGQKFGSFGNTAYCPGNSSVCGLSLKSEKPQGMADDTAVNDVVLYCCYQNNSYY